MESSTPARTLPPKVGLTRARVSQVLKDAGTAGLALERVKGRGYRLLEAPEFLDAKKVRAHPDVLLERRRGIAFPASVEVVDQIESTSSELMRRAAAARRPRRGARRGVAVGGSRPPRSRLDGDRRRQPYVLAGVEVRAGRGVSCRAVARGRRRCRTRARGRRVSRTWRSSGPNDLIHRHLKVGGILIELNGDALGPTTTVIGVGLNVRIPAGGPQGHPGAGHRSRVHRRTPGAARSIATGCSRRSSPSLPQCSSSMRTKVSRRSPPEWQHRHAYQGKPVRLLLPDGARPSRARSRAWMRAARLVLADGPRRARFLSGEITLRRA